jgi:DNA-binding transcriptional LysR family regulator
MIQALKAFAAAAAEGSFSAAARRLGMSQPSVSEHIRALETHYGLMLFERVGREVRLTAAGAKLYEHSGRVLAALEDLERDLQELKEGTAGVLEVATSPIPGEAILPLLLPRFQELRPGVQVRESVGDVRTVVDRLLRREVEVAIVGGPFYDDRVEAAFFARDEMALIARRDHPLAGQGPLRATEVCRYPLVLRSEGSGARTAVEAALVAAGVDPASIQVAAELGSTEAVKRAVEAGLGVAFVSVCTLAAAGPAGELRALPLADEPPTRDLLVLTERGRARTALAETFRSFLLSPETLREVAGHTRLPTRLRPAGPTVVASGLPPTRPDEPKAPPSSGLEGDPLLPARVPGGPTYRLAREPSTPDEERVARVLAETPGGAREELLEHLADELRQREGDPLSGAPDVGLFRLELYEEEASAMLDRMVGDLLIEAEPE